MMDKNLVLVVGSTGQLGTTVVRKLLERKHSVRALVRPSSNHQHLLNDQIDLAFGDLRDPQSLEAACLNVDTVIATANAAVPRERHDTFKTVDDAGYQNLIHACKRQHVRHFIFVSVLSDPLYNRMPLPHMKRITELRLQSSGISYTIFRSDAFMDIVFPLMGTDLLLTNVECPTLKRPFWFSNRFFRSVKDNIANKGEVGILGDGRNLRTYIAINDVAEFLVRAVELPEARNAIFDLGGPEALSQNDILEIFRDVLQRQLKPKYSPAFIFKFGHALLSILSPPAANIMGLNYVTATTDSVIDMTRTAQQFDVTLTSAEMFLREKIGRK